MPSRAAQPRDRDRDRGRSLGRRGAAARRALAAPPGRHRRAANRAAAQPLLSGAYYLDKALGAVQRGARRRGRDALLQGRHRRAGAARWRGARRRGQDRSARKWLEQGGMVLRFAGPHLAEQPDDDLLPVTLRRGGRTLGGALSWEQPAHLAPFSPPTVRSPGSRSRADVTVSRQVLAEPTLDLACKTWARLQRRHAAGYRGKARQGLARPGPHHRRSGMVEPRHLRAVRRDAAADRGAEPGRFRRARTSRCRRSRRSTASAGCSARPPRPRRSPPRRIRRRPWRRRAIRRASTARADARRALNLAPAVKIFAPLPRCRRALRRKPMRAAGRGRFPARRFWRGAARSRSSIWSIAFALRGLLPA